MSRFLIFTALLVAVTARTVILDRDSVPKSFFKGGYAPDNGQVHFIVALKQRNLDLLEKTFWAVSTPGSPQYREFMTSHEIIDLVAPSVEDHDVVKNWLESNGIADIKSTRDAIEATTTVAVANALFNARFYTFHQKKTGRVVYKIYGSASVPSEVAVKIDLIEGISNFPMRRYSSHAHRLPKNAPAAAAGVIPQTAALLYQIPSLSNLGYPETSESVIEFQGQNFDPADLAKYASLVDIEITPPTKEHTVGPNDPSDPQLEASLDVEFATTINNAATSWFWLEEGNGWLFQYVNHMFNTADIPEVQSISYGWSESDQCDIDGAECQKLGVKSDGYVSRVNAEFQKIGLRGVSIFVSSGDSGANGRTDPECSLKYLKPDYPGCSPYITSVGATQVNSPVFNLPTPPPICSGHGYNCVSGGTEVAVSFNHANFASGGGFSNYAPMPDYQTTAVQAYLASGVKLPPAGYFNSSNRAYPDVAAVGSDVVIYQRELYDVGGTSCSSPAFAAVAAVLNHFAKAKSGKALGFLNPFLYQMGATDPTTFHDITVGDNLCTEDGCSSSCKGFLCTKGWDPVTGLGTPNVQNMINYIANHL